MSRDGCNPFAGRSPDERSSKPDETMAMEDALDGIKERLLGLSADRYFGDVIIKIRAGRFAWWTERREHKPKDLKKTRV